MMNIFERWLERKVTRIRRWGRKGGGLVGPTMQLIEEWYTKEEMERVNQQRKGEQYGSTKRRCETTPQCEAQRQVSGASVPDSAQQSSRPNADSTAQRTKA